MQVMHSELPCDQEAPPCGATCGKTLLCGQHHCQERCHTGPCPATCRLLADKSCACGLTQRRMPCSQPLRRAACDRTDSSLSPLKTCTTIQRSPACRQAAFQSYHDHGIAALLCEGRHVFAQPSMRGVQDLRGRAHAGARGAARPPGAAGGTSASVAAATATARPVTRCLLAEPHEHSFSHCVGHAADWAISPCACAPVTSSSLRSATVHGMSACIRPQVCASAAVWAEAALRQSPVPQPLPLRALPAMPPLRAHHMCVRADQLQHPLRHRVSCQAAQMP